MYLTMCVLNPKGLREIMNHFSIEEKIREMWETKSRKMQVKDTPPVTYVVQNHSTAEVFDSRKDEI